MNPTPPTSITLASGRIIGDGHPVFIVAEIGNNHQGDLGLALEMVEAAAAAGVSAVKFQKRHTDSLLTAAGKNAPYTGPNSFGPTYGAHREALELSMEQMAALRERAEQLGLSFFVSAWDLHSLHAMLALGMDCIKISSADLVNVPMLRAAARSGLPVILSTGMSTLEQIDAAVAELKRGVEQIVLLHCNSSYPCPDSEVALPVMQQLRKRYRLPVGYSGHELGLGPSVAAAAMGACVVERHMTLDKGMRGTDHKASLDPDDFAMLVKMVREVEKAMAGGRKTVSLSERKTAEKLRKSIVARRDLPAGHVLRPEDLTCKSPGTGISPLRWDELVGARLLHTVNQDAMLRWEDLAQTDAAPPASLDARGAVE